MAAEKKQAQPGVAETPKKIMRVSFDLPLNCPPICAGDRTIDATLNGKHKGAYTIDQDGDELIITKRGLVGEVRVHKSRANGWMLQ